MTFQYSPTVALPTTQIDEKRHQLYLEIKERSRQTIMSAVRCQYLKEQRSSNLSQLINRTQTSISIIQLKSLFHYAILGMSNAVIHIGNLFLDYVLDERVFSELGTEWLTEIDGNCGYYEWLLHVLVCRRYVDDSYYIYFVAIETILSSRTQNQFRILHLLKFLTVLAKLNQYQFIHNLILSRQYKICLVNLLRYCNSQNYQISKQCWRLASYLFSHQDLQLNNRVTQNFGIENLMVLIKLGFMSVETHIRSLSCQIFTNSFAVLMFQGCDNKNLNHLIETCFCLATSSNEKISVKLQLSYFLLNFLEVCSSEKIIKTLKLGLLQAVKELNNTSITGTQQLVNNCNAIKKILSDFCNNKTLHTMPENKWEMQNYRTFLEQIEEML